MISDLFIIGAILLALCIGFLYRRDELARLRNELHESANSEGRAWKQVETLMKSARERDWIGSTEPLLLEIERAVSIAEGRLKQDVKDQHSFLCWTVQNLRTLADESRNGFQREISRHAATKDLLVERDQMLEESEEARETRRELLTKTANALKGEPAPLTQHDWSDLPTVAARLIDEQFRLGALLHQLAQRLGVETDEDGAVPEDRLLEALKTRQRQLVQANRESVQDLLDSVAAEPIQHCASLNEHGDLS